jgi:hypothetical protein
LSVAAGPRSRLRPACFHSASKPWPNAESRPFGRPATC